MNAFSALFDRAKNISASEEGDFERRGVGFCFGHFGEILQGVFSYNQGYHRGLVTTPCYSIGTSVSIQAKRGSGRIEVDSDKQKIRRAINAYTKYYDIEGTFDLSVSHGSSIPIGVGMGSSTADIIATLRALDEAFETNTKPDVFAQLCLKAEKASDSLMFSKRACLFAQRDGIVLHEFNRALPSMTIVSVNLAPKSEFDTDATPAATYSTSEIKGFDVLKDKLAAGINSADLQAVADVASASAFANQQHFPKPKFQELVELSKREGALGVCVAHSGTVAGLIFRPNTEFFSDQHPNITASLTAEGFHPFGTFSI